VQLSREIRDRKSVTALVVAAHEVGHAIQDGEGYERVAKQEEREAPSLSLSEVKAELDSPEPPPPRARGAGGVTATASFIRSGDR
jgi:hypothetical protein